MRSHNTRYSSSISSGKSLPQCGQVRFEQIIVNLLNNAAKYNPGGRMNYPALFRKEHFK